MRGTHVSLRMKASFVFVLYLASCLSGSAVAKGYDLSELLESSAVTGGIVLHLGCGNGQGTATLHARDRLLRVVERITALFVAREEKQ